ncbi:50S ribosomal protein L25 [Candidatus Kaiserbacteria bacterium]|nr:50S ribosomal protein L25 [Candidatus Kaiserbacteria bacterium]
MLALEVQIRDPKVTSDQLRGQGIVPAVMYGHKEPAQSIAINAGVLEGVWRDAGETTVITLKGLKDDKETLIRDVQVHPVTGKILHMDFYVLEKGKKIEIAVPLHFVGEAPAEKAGHVLAKALHEIEIEVAPAHLPHSLDVDISSLSEVGDHITAAQIKLPESAALVTDSEEIVVSVTEQEEEAVEATPATEAPAVEGAAAPAAETSVQE